MLISIYFNSSTTFLAFLTFSMSQNIFLRHFLLMKFLSRSPLLNFQWSKNISSRFFNGIERMGRMFEKFFFVGMTRNIPSKVLVKLKEANCWDAGKLRSWKTPKFRFINYNSLPDFLFLLEFFYAWWIIK